MRECETVFCWTSNTEKFKLYTFFYWLYKGAI